MAAGRILVVAPDGDLRRSLGFALEAEGYDVTLRADLPDHSWVSRESFDATVLDQRALTGAAYQSIAFCVKAHPVILLATNPHPWLVSWVADVIDLPVIDNALATSLRHAIHVS